MTAATARSPVASRIRRLVRSPGFVLFLLVLPAVAPLLRPGFFVSDDGRFHVYRIAALATAWSDGVLHPRLFPDFGFGYGQAVLNYYAPLSYWPGAFATLFGLGPATAAQLTIALAFFLAAFAAYGYVGSLWGPAAGLLAGVVYTYFPYHLADAYTRGAIPEHAAFIFPPLIFWAYTKAFRDEQPLPAFLWGSLAWAGLVFTHNLTALLVAPATAVYLLLLAATTRRWRRLLPAVGSLALAIALSAVYWLPVLGETPAVGLALGPSQGYANHLLSAATFVQRTIAYRYRDDAGMGVIYPFNWLALGLLALVAVLVIWRWRQRRLPPHIPVLVFHLVMAVVAMFMMTTAALWLWRPFSFVLGHLQYPWRFLVLVALGIAVSVAALPALWPRVRPAVWVLAVFALSLVVGMVRLPTAPLPMSDAETWSPARMWHEDAEAGQVGATWTAEFLPLTVTEQRWALGRPLEDAVDGPSLQPPPSVIIDQRQAATLTVRTATEQPFELRLHQFYLPGWNVQIDGSTSSTYPSGEMGLVTVGVPAGNHVIALSFGATMYRLAGAVITTLAVLVWAGLALWKLRGRRVFVAAAIALLLLTAALTLNSLGVGRRVWTPQPVQAQFEDVAQLIGRDVRPATGEAALDVTLYWFALRDTASNYKVFVHLLDPQGQVISQHDGDPVGGFSPTSRWRAGEIIADTHRIPLPPDLPPGPYGLKAGLYEFAGTPRNLAVTPATPDNRASLGDVTLD